VAVNRWRRRGNWLICPQERYEREGRREGGDVDISEFPTPPSAFRSAPIVLGKREGGKLCTCCEYRKENGGKKRDLSLSGDGTLACSRSKKVAFHAPRNRGGMGTDSACPKTEPFYRSVKKAWGKKGGDGTLYRRRGEEGTFSRL